jgi:DNA repair exonuclease SbcCD ATPase subunit
MQKITALKIRWKNFLSYGNIWHEIIFENGVSTFITGENLDTNSRNGCGKTGILNAIVYAIYDKPFDNIGLPRLINSTNAAKNTLMEVEYTFAKGEDIYVIHRKRGESHGVTLFENGLDITPDSVNETDALIERIYGRSYDLFTRVVVFAGNTTPFLELPVSLQRAHIEELFNITVLSEKAVKLKKVIQNTESDIKVEEALLKERETTLKLRKAKLSEFEQKVITWEEQTASKLVDYRAQLASVEGIDFTQEREWFEKRSDLNKRIAQMNNSKASLLRTKARQEKEINQLLAQQEHLQNDKCPFCLQNMADAPSKIIEIENKLLELATDFDKTESDLEQIEVQLSTAQQELDEVVKNITYDNLPALLNTLENVTSLQMKVKELEHAFNPYFETFEQLEAETLEAIDYSRLDELKSESEHNHFLLKLLIDKNSFIRRRIISRTIPFLNLQMNNYSRALGLPHVIEFKDDMTCSVSQYSQERDFGNLSSGEKKRVNLSMSLAFRDVMHHLHAKDSLLFVDEIDASLDTIGVEDVVNLLKRKTKEDNLSTWVIMHRDGIENKFDRNLTIRKHLGFSEMIWNNESKEIV